MRWIILLIGVVGCGGHDPGDVADANPDAPDAAVSDAPEAADGAPGPDSTPGPDGDPGCEAQIGPIGAEMYMTIGSCTVVVRLDYQTFALLGWQLICAPYGASDEANARATAQADTGFGAAGARLSPSPPEDEWVFWEAPTDLGGAAAVSARTGRTVFGGSIIWNGTGDLTYPTTWRPPPATGCADLGPIQSTGYDLDSGAAGLPAADLDAALAVVRSSPFPAALWTGGYVFDAVVLRYPRSVGDFIPDTAEWIVLLNGGWLE